jgi:gas vesicle protein
MLNQNTTIAFVAGWLIGGLCGATLAIMLAPQRGEETRAQIKDKTIELKNRTAESVAEAGQRAQNQMTDWQEKGQAAIEKGQRNVAEAINQGKQHVAETMPGS